MNATRSARSLAFKLSMIVSALSFFVSSAHAYMEVLPGEGFYPGWNGRTLSANGNVMIGLHVSENESYYFRWTSSGSTTRLPSGPGGYGWDESMHMSDTGNTIVGDGEHIGEMAMIWDLGIGTRTVTDGKNSMYIGVTPDASYAVRVDLGTTRQVAYRDYPDGSFSKWASDSGDYCYIKGTSGDASKLYGTAHDSYFDKVLPCYWNSAGDIVFCAALSDQLNPTPILANKNGQFITGTIDLGKYIPDYGDATTTFVWNTATNQVSYYTPLSLMFNYPLFISPDGQILGIGGYITPYEYTSYILDQSSPSEAALGYQEVGDWLVSHHYVSSADLQGRTHFVVTAMSDDTVAVAGLFMKNNRSYAFYARRLVATKVPPFNITN